MTNDGVSQLIFWFFSSEVIKEKKKKRKEIPLAFFFFWFCPKIIVFDRVVDNIQNSHDVVKRREER